MNPEQDPSRREELEVRIVALLLGEASAFEADELRQTMEKDADLAAFHDHMKRTIGLVQEASKKFTAETHPAPQPQLSPERREKLLAQFRKDPKPIIPLVEAQPPRRRRRWLVPVAAAAAVVALLAMGSFFVWFPSARLHRYAESAPLAPSVDENGRVILVNSTAEGERVTQIAGVADPTAPSTPTPPPAVGEVMYNYTVAVDPAAAPPSKTPPPMPTVTLNSEVAAAPDVVAAAVSPPPPAAVQLWDDQAQSVSGGAVAARTKPRIVLPGADASGQQPLDLNKVAAGQAPTEWFAKAIQPVAPADGAITFSTSSGLVPSSGGVRIDASDFSLAATATRGVPVDAFAPAAKETTAEFEQLGVPTSTTFSGRPTQSQPVMGFGLAGNGRQVSGQTEGESHFLMPAQKAAKPAADLADAPADLYGRVSEEQAGRGTARHAFGGGGYGGGGPAGGPGGYGGYGSYGGGGYGARGQMAGQAGGRGGGQSGGGGAGGPSMWGGAAVDSRSAVDSARVAEKAGMFGRFDAEPARQAATEDFVNSPKQDPATGLPLGYFDADKEKRLSEATARRDTREALDEWSFDSRSRLARSESLDAKSERGRGELDGSLRRNGAVAGVPVLGDVPLLGSLFADTDGDGLKRQQARTGLKPSVADDGATKYLNGTGITTRDEVGGLRFLGRSGQAGGNQSQTGSGTTDFFSAGDVAVLGGDASVLAKAKQNRGDVTAYGLEGRESRDKDYSAPATGSGTLATPADHAAHFDFQLRGERRAAIPSPRATLSTPVGGTARIADQEAKPVELGLEFAEGEKSMADAGAYVVTEDLAADSKSRRRALGAEPPVAQGQIATERFYRLAGEKRLEAEEARDRMAAPQASTPAKPMPSVALPGIVSGKAVGYAPVSLTDESKTIGKESGQEKLGDLARAKVAETAPATRLSSVAPAAPRLPMPSLKGTPDELPSAANIQPLAEAQKEQLAKWEEIRKSVTATAPEQAKPAELAQKLDVLKLEGAAHKAVQLQVRTNAVVVSGPAPANQPVPSARPPSEPPAKKPVTPPPTPQPEVITTDNAFSTFSLNVSDVSFKLAGASLEGGALPDPGSVRVEEFVNAFNYRDPAPARGARLAFAWERARYPFAHNRDMLRFAVQTAARGREAQKPLNLVILLDNSGSMERPDRVAILREALKVLAAQLRPQDRISVIAFARTPRLWVDGMAGGKPQEFLARVIDLNPQGGTNLEEAMDLAYATAMKHFQPQGMNRVILLTDGAANLGNVEPEDLKKKVVAHRQKGIALDCFGVGWEGLNDDLLEVLSRNGDGRYGFLNAPEQAAPEFADQLAGALNVSAADVKTQVEFNPRRVASWRQIGYAKHQLKKEQFRDNTVDAAEIAAAEQGNALYVVQVNPEGSGPIGVVRVRYKVPATGEYVEQEWTIPCQPKVAALDQAGPAMRLAATAAAFGEWLARSPFAGGVQLGALLSHLNGVPAAFAPDPRPEKLVAMIRQAQSLAGK